MQYFGRAIGSVSKTWNSINPATLSGAIDVIVVEDEDGEMRCSPFHVRFGKFQLLRPSQKKVSVIVNGEVTDIPMKLSDEGEAFFVFETDGYVPEYLQTSPVVSARSSPSASPRLTPSSMGSNEELEYLDIGEGANDSINPNMEDSNKIIRDGDESNGNGNERYSRHGSMSPIERARSITMKLNIPSKVEANGDILLDMHGYKSDKKDIKETDALVKQLLQEEFGEDIDTTDMFNTDLEGNIRIVNKDGAYVETKGEVPPSIAKNEEGERESDSKSPTVSIHVPSPVPTASSRSSEESKMNFEEGENHEIHYKTLRLTSEQLKCLSLNYGENDVKYSVNNGKSIVMCKMYLWKRSTPIVISDIDGTITRSDALGHVLTMLGRDWTHEGVAKLFDDIEFNGYNIMYLTARSVGLADTTRAYLRGVEQDGIKLPMGPVILSPDRTIAALRREIVLKKPEVFKMSCLNDIRTLYYPEKTNPLEHDQRHLFESYEDYEEEEEEGEENEGEEKEEQEEEEGSDEYGSEFTDLNTNTDPSKLSDDMTSKLLDKDGLIRPVVDESSTPFYAGFGNRITDAISYRSVGVPSSRIFTINPDGDVKMELLEMAGYKSSYVSIVELVDQFFPPVEIRVNDSNGKGEIEKGKEKTIPGSLQMSMSNARNKYTDFNYWRSPDIDLSLISDEDEDEAEGEKGEEGEEEREETEDNNNNNNNNNNRGIIEAGSEDDVKSVGSRFSFFLRSPRLSPTKTDASGPGDADGETEVSRQLAEQLAIKDEDEDDDEDDDVQDPDYEDEGSGGESDSDSDYIYETSDDEADEGDADAVDVGVRAPAPAVASAVSAAGRFV